MKVEVMHIQEAFDASHQRWIPRLRIMDYTIQRERKKEIKPQGYISKSEVIIQSNLIFKMKWRSMSSRVHIVHPVRIPDRDLLSDTRWIRTRSVISITAKALVVADRARSTCPTR